jgi:hypothetical protein
LHHDFRGLIFADHPEAAEEVLKLRANCQGERNMSVSCTQLTRPKTTQRLFPNPLFVQNFGNSRGFCQQITSQTNFASPYFTKAANLGESKTATTDLESSKKNQEEAMHTSKLIKYHSEKVGKIKLKIGFSREKLNCALHPYEYFGIVKNTNKHTNLLHK